MAETHHIVNQSGTYYLTWRVYRWVDIFINSKYCDIITDAFTYCRLHKGLNIYAYVIMTNHVHCVISAKENNLSDVLRDLKRHTSNSLLKKLINTENSRTDWMLEQFSIAAGRHQRNEKYQIWEHTNHAIELYSNEFINQKIGYIHQNPVKAGLVEHAHYWRYSSQSNYLGMESVIEIDVLDLNQGNW